MKATTLRMLVGVTAPLILSAAASGGFLGITTTSKPNPYGLLTVNVYAVFDRPGEDHMTAVAGTPNTQLTIEVIGGTFYQHPAGSDTPPLAFIVQVFPSLAYDTFVTIGVKMRGDPGGQPEDHLILTATWPGFGASTLETTDAAWAIIPSNAQGDPFNPDFVAGNGQVLIGQYSTLDGTAIHGTMLLHYISNGVVIQSVESFFIPGGPACPWDCGRDDDGSVGIVDFLALLAQWGTLGTCDFDDGGVGITDFLELLANWGPCP